nr:hypothetical protein DBT45_10465 [Aerococcus tenax]
MLITAGGVGDREGEAPFLRKMTRSAPHDVKLLLTAIDAYETFSRVLTNAFDGLRYCASCNGGAPVDAEDFFSVETAKSVFTDLEPSLKKIRSHPTLLEWEGDQNGLAQAVDRFSGVQSCGDLFDAILSHHEYVQREKPPNGKRSWFEHSLRGKVVLRAGYELPEMPAETGYVHEYRIRTFSRFMTELGILG